MYEREVKKQHGLFINLSESDYNRLNQICDRLGLSKAETIRLLLRLCENISYRDIFNDPNKKQGEVRRY